MLSIESEGKSKWQGLLPASSQSARTQAAGLMKLCGSLPSCRILRSCTARAVDQMLKLPVCRHARVRVHHGGGSHGQSQPLYVSAGDAH